MCTGIFDLSEITALPLTRPLSVFFSPRRIKPFLFRHPPPRVNILFAKLRCYQAHPCKSWCVCRFWLCSQMTDIDHPLLQLFTLLQSYNVTVRSCRIEGKETEELLPPACSIPITFVSKQNTGWSPRIAFYESKVETFSNEDL